ncbi:MAG: DUF4845 domain-containing protein [Pseudomonadota bacterium]
MNGRLRHGVRGLGLWGYVGLLLGVAVVVTLVLRLAPHYMNFQTVQTVVEGLGEESPHQLSKRQINEMLVKRFKINSLYDLKPKDILEVKRGKDQTVVAVDYEVREPLVANADVILRFQREFAFK